MPFKLEDCTFRSVNNESFQWRASRLLMCQSASYFQVCCSLDVHENLHFVTTNLFLQVPLKKSEVTTNMAPFLEEVIKQTATGFPVSFLYPQVLLK